MFLRFLFAAVGRTAAVPKAARQEKRPVPGSKTLPPGTLCQVQEALRCGRYSKIFLQAALRDLEGVIEQHGAGDHAEAFVEEAVKEIETLQRTLQALQKDVRFWQAARQADV